MWELSLEEAAPRLRPFLQDSVIERWPVFSPDGWWLAYGSDVSGRMEVYLRPYPGPGPRVQVSLHGGTNPLWNPRGRELFFSSLPDNAGVSSMMLVPVETGAMPRVGTPRRLFEWEPAVVRDQPVSLYDVAPDGQRFYAIQQLPEPAPPVVTHIRLVQNWFEELKAKAPVK